MSPDGIITMFWRRVSTSIYHCCYNGTVKVALYSAVWHNWFTHNCINNQYTRIILYFSFLAQWSMPHKFCRWCTTLGGSALKKIQVIFSSICCGTDYSSQFSHLVVIVYFDAVPLESISNRNEMYNLKCFSVDLFTVSCGTI